MFFVGFALDISIGLCPRFWFYRLIPSLVYERSSIGMAEQFTQLSPMDSSYQTSLSVHGVWMRCAVGQKVAKT